MVVGRLLYHLYHLLGHLLGWGLVCSVVDSGSSRLLLDLMLVMRLVLGQLIVLMNLLLMVYHSFRSFRE